MPAHNSIKTSEEFQTEAETRRHHHSFVIPVEWKNVFTTQRGIEHIPELAAEVPTGKRVTKLRCACGDEVER